MLSRVATKQKYAFRTKCKLKKHLKNGWWKKLRRKNHICQRWRSSQLIMISFSLLLLLTQISQLHWDQILIFSCPQQLNRWPCHSLTHSVTQSLPLLKNSTKEHSQNLVTLETCDQSDDPTFSNFRKIWDFRINFKFSENFQNFWLSEKNQILWNNQIFRKISE